MKEILMSSNVVIPYARIIVPMEFALLQILASAFLVMYAIRRVNAFQLVPWVVAMEYAMSKMNVSASQAIPLNQLSVNIVYLNVSLLVSLVNVWLPISALVWMVIVLMLWEHVNLVVIIAIMASVLLRDSAAAMRVI